MFRACILFAILALSSAVDLQYSTIITSADVTVNVPKTITNLQPNKLYRIYATYAAAGSDDYAKNVIIYDSTGARFTIHGLSQPKPDAKAPYILDNMRTLRAPISIHDQNNAASTAFTVYFVDYDRTTFPVVNARLANNGDVVDSNNGFIAAGITVLSAESYFTMSSFDIGGLSSMSISSVGYDDGSSQYNLLNVHSSNEARLSFISVYGPIATVFNTNWGINARFQFQFTRNTKFDYPLAPGASFALVSPGYLTKDSSYNVPQVADALDRSYTFSGSSWIQAWYTAKDFQNGENIQVSITQDNQAANPTTLSSDVSSSWTGQWANKISMKVMNANGNHAPRFLFQVTSGSTLSFSLLGVLLVSLFKNFY